MTKRRAVFLDRDGTINEEVGYLDTIEKLSILPEAFEAVRLINGADMLAVVITNQSGIARGYFDEALVIEVHRRMAQRFEEQGARIDDFFYCPHHPEGRGPYRLACTCRKPEAGMLFRAAEKWNVDLANSYMIGDTLRDVEASRKAGGKGILVKTGYGSDQAREPLIGPDYVGENVLDAVRWILADARKDER